jgi:hypothetical protein
MLGATVPNLVAMVSRRPGCVHPCPTGLNTQQNALITVSLGRLEQCSASAECNQIITPRKLHYL